MKPPEFMKNCYKIMSERCESKDRKCYCKEIDLDELFDYLKAHHCIFENLTLVEFKKAFSLLIQSELKQEGKDRIC